MRLKIQPRSRSAYSNEDDEKISNWAKDVAASDAVHEPLQRESDHCKHIFRLCWSDWPHSDEELHVPEEPNSFITSFSFSLDGKQIACGFLDGKIRIWDIEEEQYSVTFQGHSYSVESVSFSLDGKRIVSGSKDRTLCIWDAQTRICNIGPIPYSLLHSRPMERRLSRAL